MPLFDATLNSQGMLLAGVLGSVVLVALVWLLVGRAAGRDTLIYRVFLRVALASGVGWITIAALDGLGVMSAVDVLSAANLIANHPLVTLGGVDVTTFAIGVFLGFVLLTWWLSTIAGRGAAGALRRRAVLEDGTIDALSRLVQYAVAGVGFAVSLQAVGINLGALVAAGAVLAVGIGFALQHVAENFVSGLILLVERSITQGDIVTIDGEMMRVHTLGLRSTMATTLDDEQIIIPNTYLVQNRVKNLTLGEKILRVRLKVGVAYSSDLDIVLRVLKMAADGVGSRAESRETVVALEGFGDSTVDFEVSVWTAQPWRVQAVRSDLALRVWDALKEAEVEIAFPQLDVHLHSEG